MKTTLKTNRYADDFDCGRQRIRLNLVEYLESKNYQTDNTDDGLKALALTIVNKYDLIVLDIMLPGMDGLRLCRELRSRGNTTPIIILSAKDSTDDRIMGLSEGADDYIVKPFSLAELLLRIQAVLRRSSTPEEKVLQVGDLRLELDSKRVLRYGAQTQSDSFPDFGLFDAEKPRSGFS